MDKVTNHITLDMSVERKQNVRCVIEDSDTRYIYIKITDKGKLYNFVESDVVWFRFVKPDGNIVIWKLGENSRFTKSNDELIVELNQDCTSAVGIGEAEIRIESYDVNTEIITSMSFNIVIIKNVISNEEIASRSDFTDLVDYTTKDLVSSADLSVNVETSTMKLDLKNKKGIVIDTNTVKIPSGGSDVTSETVSNWGFVKNNNPSFTGNFSMNRKSGTTVGINSVAEGTNCEASGDYSHADGYYTKSTGAYSKSEGNYTEATGSSSHSEGQGSKAKGTSSHAEGNYTEASGFATHAEGNHTIASAGYSHAEGYYTTATGQYQHVQGKYNVEDTENKYAHIVGGGEYRNPKNINTLDWEGNSEFAGDVKANACGGNSPVSLVEVSNVASNAIPSSAKGIANGVAELDENGKVPVEQLPEIPTGVSIWDEIENKPFESIGSGLSVVDGALSVINTPSPIERIYLDWGDTYIGSESLIEQNARVISTLDIYGFSGTGDTNLKRIKKETMIMAKHFNPNLRIVRYVDAGSGKTKQTMYNDIDDCLDFYGSELNDVGVFFDQFDDLTNCGDGKEFEDSIHRQNDLVDYAHSKGFFVIGNAWDFMSHITCTPTPVWNISGIRSTMNENDYWLIESCTFYPNDDASSSAYNYASWGGLNSIDKLYQYYKTWYGNTCDANAIDFSSSGINMTEEEKEYALTWLCFSTIARGGNSVCFDRGNLITKDTNEILNEYYYENRSSVSFDKVRDGEYKTYINGHSIRVVLDSTYGGIANKKSFNNTHIYIDGVETKNIFGINGSYESAVNKEIVNINKKIEDLDVTKKENAPLYYRAMIDDWIVENNIDAYPNILNVKGFDFINGINITDMNVETHSYNGNNSNWTSLGYSYWIVNLDNDFSGKKLELGCSNFISDNPNIYISISNSADNANPSTINLTTSNESVVGNTSGICVSYTVPNDTSTLYVRIGCKGGNYGTDVTWEINKLYLIDPTSVPELHGKDWYTNLFPSSGFTDSGLGSIETKTTDSLNRSFYNLTGNTNSLCNYRKDFTGSFVEEKRGHTLEIGCFSFEVDESINADTFKLILGAAWDAKGIKYTDNKVVSLFGENNKVLRHQYKVPEDATQISVGIQSGAVQSGIGYSINGIYLYDLDESDIIIRGENPSDTWIRICRVTEEKLEQHPELLSNALYISDNESMFITDFNKVKHKIGGSSESEIYQGAVDAGFTGTPYEFGQQLYTLLASGGSNISSYMALVPHTDVIQGEVTINEPETIQEVTNNE